MPTATSAQEFLAIDTVREDAVVLKDGGLRVVLMCSSLNFALKSSEEQDAVIFQYQNFLNSLDFSLQFVIHSRKLNIEPYLESLKERQKEEDSDLLKIQIYEYQEFIKTFVSMTNIMSKTFYVVVPFTPSALERGGFWRDWLETLGLSPQKKQNSTGLFEEHKNQLWQRVDTAVSGLHSFGIRAVPLNTEELIELFYGLYNPTEFEKTIAPGEG
ncbi:MAG: hypothetical protein HYW89_02580 [Candidatus Sungiibacteriota bacterium]|uniref:TraC-like domain-containing protein n=1 Tax=Candidatus Sungiibacteriota bacterium TaxID=2750080 RepID=A0A7T5RIN7_9BACT|nr:MAG: hypothetical protein HYW89_02580 [Candidatus Sungbacteria bacterium]